MRLKHAEPSKRQRRSFRKCTEYDAAKEAQGMLEMRIAKLEVHSNAR
jgi:transcription elongation GreA/GreB family factor